MMYLQYKIYTYNDQASDGSYYYTVQSTSYSSYDDSSDKLINFDQTTEIYSVRKSDIELNLHTWDKLHEDWQIVYDKQNEEDYAKYLKKRNYLYLVIQELIVWFKDHNKGKYPDHERKEFVCSDDYRAILFHGKKYSLTIKDSFIIKILHEHAMRRTPDLSFASINTSYDENFQTSYRNIREMFTDKKVYKALVAKGVTQGTIKLNL